MRYIFRSLDCIFGLVTHNHNKDVRNIAYCYSSKCMTEKREYLGPKMTRLRVLFLQTLTITGLFFVQN